MNLTNPPNIHPLHSKSKASVSLKFGKSKYYPKVDGLRFVAISFVLIEHFGSYLSNFIAAGYYGVDLFFVISGFLITGILIDQSDKPLSEIYRNFMGRRILRIFPIYYLTILVLFLFHFEEARQFFPWLITYTFNYAAALHDGPNRLFYLWSLSVEEQFYLFWPLIAIPLRNRISILFGITAAIVIFSFTQRLFPLVPALTEFNYVGLPNRMGSLGLGAMMAMVPLYVRIPRRVLDSLILEISAIILLAWGLIDSNPFRFPAMGICSAFFVLKAAFSEFKINWINDFLTHSSVLHIGRISYGIYLFHIPIAFYFQRFIFDPIWGTVPFIDLGPLAKVQYHSWMIKLPLYSAVTILFASLSYQYLERPILSLKDKYFHY